MTLDFGENVTLPGTQGTGDNRVTLTTVARLADVPAAADAAALASGVTVDDGLAGVAATQQFDAVEPRLVVAKSVDRVTADIDEVVTFTLEVAHNPASAADARDVVVTDPVLGSIGLDKLDLIEGSVRVVGGGPGSVSLGDDAGERTLRVEIGHLALGQVTTIEYQAKANGKAGALGDVIDGAATVDYASAPTEGRTYAADDDAPFITNATGIAAVSTAVVDTDLPANTRRQRCRRRGRELRGRRHGAQRRLPAGRRLRANRARRPGADRRGRRPRRRLGERDRRHRDDRRRHAAAAVRRRAGRRRRRAGRQRRRRDGDGPRRRRAGRRAGRDPGRDRPAGQTAGRRSTPMPP